MPPVFLGEIASMFEISCLPANANGRLQIEWEMIGITFVFPRFFIGICGPDEVIQTRYVP